MADRTGTTVVLLHALGASARSWDGVVAALGDRMRALPLDLPGFGSAAGSRALTVDAMLDDLTARIQDLVTGRWLLVGHSMGGKLATLLTRRAEDGPSTGSGGAGLPVPDGLLLVAASPPAPEPMAESRRAEMLGWWAAGSIARADAERYVDMNSTGALPSAVRAVLVEDVLRSSAAAWTEWLEHGSREDRTAEAGVLRTPAVLLAGAEDTDLGAAAQRRLNLPHLPGADVHEVERAAHLVPEERPDAVADAIAALAGAGG